MSTGYQESQHRRDVTGKFAPGDRSRDDAGQVLGDEFVVSETSTDGGRTVVRTYSDGSTETQMKGLRGEGSERSYLDGSKTRTKRTKRYVHDSEGEVEDVLFTDSQESWTGSGGYSLSETAQNSDGSSTFHTIERGAHQWNEQWIQSDTESTMSLTVVRDGAHIEATFDTGGQVRTFRQEASKLGEDPLAMMAAQARVSR